MVTKTKEEKLAMKLAQQFLQKSGEWTPCELGELRVLWISQTDDMWQCFVISDVLNNYSECVEIEYTIKTGEAFIQYLTPEEDATIFVWTDTEVE